MFTTLQRPLVLTMMFLCLSVAYVAIAADSFTIYNNGTTTSPLTPIFQKDLEQGFGSKTITQVNNGTTTNSLTYTFSPTPVRIAMRISEVTPADTNIATGVVYWYWVPGAVPRLNMKYRDATGTIHVGSFTFVP